MKRIAINNQINDNQKHDEDEMRKLDSELKEIYNKILTNENMAAYNDAKNAMDDLMNQVSTILMHSVNGADPETCPSKQESVVPAVPAATKERATNRFWGDCFGWFVTDDAAIYEYQRTA